MADFVRWNERKVDPATGMDISFLDGPHRNNPRRLYSQTGADWQMRVDMDRLRKDRLKKLQGEMKVDNLGALILFAGANIRYATASYQGNWKYNINIRYAVVPAEGASTLFDTGGSDLQCAKIDLRWMEPGRIRPAVTWQWAEGAVPFMAGRMADSVMDVLKEHKVEKEKIGIDNLDMPAFEALTKLGLTIVNGWPAVSRARVVKTPDEIELYREVYDSMYAGIAQLKPGNTTADVVKQFPHYDDDEYTTVTLQQFAHSIGITLYEGMWMSRAYSMKYPAPIKENMYFAIETFAGHPYLEQTCRLEENVLVTANGPVVFTRMEHMEEAMK